MEGGSTVRDKTPIKIYETQKLSKLALSSWEGKLMDDLNPLFQWADSH